MIRAALLAVCLFPNLVLSQEVNRGAGAILRGLDKVNGKSTDMELSTGGVRNFGNLTIALGECRYPAGNPSGDAFAFVTVTEEGADAPVFKGWMIAKSPALNALDHARYDVWVLRCKTS